MPRVVLDRGLPQRKHLRRKSGLERMSAKRAQADRDRGGERTECQEDLQAGFLVLFLVRCGRFLP
jgi:hypothetical protein